MPQTIVAVAIGPAYRQVTINNSTVPAGVRKYINGFVAAFPHSIGAAADYVIDYRECPASTLDTQVFTNNLQADYILCLSTRVVTAAAVAYPEDTNMPIIGIVSRPRNYFFYDQGNVCGVSAERSNDARFAYRKLLDTANPALARATVLYDPNYAPSQDALQDIRRVINPDPPSIKVQNAADVQTAIGQLPASSAILLLPVDWMFGSASLIIGWAIARPVLDFWFVTDWVVPTPTASAFGGYGVSQEVSGRYLAAQLEIYWRSGRSPNPSWTNVVPNDRTWQASQTRATGASITLNTQSSPRGPVIVA
jgi:hypothetical protein